MVDRSPRGSTTGNSTDSSIRDRKMYHPSKHIAKRIPPPAYCRDKARDSFPCAKAKKDAERHPTICPISKAAVKF